MFPFCFLLLMNIVIRSSSIHHSCDGSVKNIASNLKFKQNDEASFYSTIYPVLRAEENNFVKLTTPPLDMKVGFNSVMIKAWSRLPDDIEVLNCYSISYEVEDVDECSMPVDSPWRHNCHSSTRCLNTEGSYECVCEEGISWGVNDSGSPGMSSYDSSKGAVKGRCGGFLSTEDCCRDLECTSDKGDLCMKTCKSKFRCTSNPCEGVKCMAHASCKSDGTGVFGGFMCECNQGYEMNSSQECVKIVKQVNEACFSNFSCPSKCKCNPVGLSEYECSAPAGYTAIYGSVQQDSSSSHKYRRLDNIVSCKSDTPPKIYMKGPKTLYYTQGDTYEEYGISLFDADGWVDLDYDSFFVEYSEPIFPYFKNVGTYQITYSVDRTREVREIVVSDVNECTYTGPLEQYKSKCTKEAICKNTVGSYECACAPGYEGDGRIDGKGCVDVVPPVVRCEGKGCGVFHVKAANFVGVVDSDGVAHTDGSTANLTEEIIEGYLEKMVATMCQSDSNAPCFVATDYTVHGPKDLTAKIKKGNLEKDPLHEYTWRVPFTATDEAGNVSDVVYFIIQAELVDLLAAVKGVTVDSILYKRVTTGVMVFSYLIGLLFCLVFIKWISTPWQAVKCVLRPFSLVTNKEDFDRGYDFLLCLTSFGTMSKLQRRRKTAAQWLELLDRFTEMQMAGDENEPRNLFGGQYRGNNMDYDGTADNGRRFNGGRYGGVHTPRAPLGYVNSGRS